ncbi:maltose and multiple sugar ABC transporter permease AmyC [Paenibacillus alvei TS-15]|uniref:Maltose and multiple sugar ABC transporter permease AmyC n=1 Tax=Paenibacillus alvei TS-15 TaxID=1117108 RepID=S9SYI6_PAEAL|nr:carbohydrate ABC transporter permease [Paenibacillus alvei]EPY09178.1 maltose and multiple sugar ABC transporter permease AmyC [Paenibacillus alvei TS-15]
MKIAKYIALVLIVLIHSIPFYILVNLSFKPIEDTSSKWMPSQQLQVDNFIHAWQDAQLGRAVMNNGIITVTAVILVVFIGACASYPLARHQTKWNRFVYTLCISCLIVPALTILVPLYKFIVDVGGINTYWAIILTQVTFALPLTIFLFTGFISTVPREMDEAGLIDGCSRYGIFLRIIFPLLKPITATVVILIGVQVWNDYQFSVFFLQKKEMMTIPVALSGFVSQFHSNISWVAAGCFIGMLPLTVVYLFLQKYFVKGMVDGAIKG